MATLRRTSCLTHPLSRKACVGRRRRGLLVRTAYAACLLGATFNHAGVVARHGLFWDYGGVPAASAVFWTSLTALDPMTAILLFVWPNAGVAATGAIIVTDVIHNTWITAQYAPPHRAFGAMMADPFMVSQIAFMLFVMATMPIARSRSPAQTPQRQGHTASHHKDADR